jgi:hypothetical protein
MPLVQSVRQMNKCRNHRLIRRAYSGQRGGLLADFVECSCDIVQRQLVVVIGVILDEQVVPGISTRLARK